jgi:hypothetical protein
VSQTWVICQNITVPNNTTKTCTKYNNGRYEFHSLRNQYWSRYTNSYNIVFRRFIKIHSQPLHKTIAIYYIDRCQLLGFIREINSGISHVRYLFFPAGTTLQNCKCGGYVPCCVTLNTHTIVNWKKFREMLLTTLAHNQHDVIVVIWRLPVWNVRIRRFCGFMYASMLTKFN